MPSSARAASATMEARSPLVTQALLPLRTYSSPSRCGPARDVAGVAPGVGLGEGEGAPPFPRRHGGEPALLLLLGAVRHDQGGGHGVGVHDAGQAHPAVGELLDDADVGQQVEAEAAVLLGDGDAEEAERAHLLHDLVGEGVGPLEIGRDGDDLALHEAADGLDDLGPDVLVGCDRVGLVTTLLRRPSGRGACHAGRTWSGTAFLTAITIHFVRVDAESQFGEECFPMATSLMHRGLESAAERFPDHVGRAGG